MGSRPLGKWQNSEFPQTWNYVNYGGIAYRPIRYVPRVVWRKTPFGYVKVLSCVWTDD